MSPRRAIHPDFRKRYKSMHSQGLALMLECSHFSLSRWMNAEALRVTPFVVQRLATLAVVLDYAGPIFQDEVR
jgi:hypothetical protein